MKRRSVIILVSVAMALAILGIAFTVATNTEVVKTAFSAPWTEYSHQVIQVLTSLALILVCLITLLVIFIRLLKSDNFIELGKKDSLTNIGNRNYLESVYKKHSCPYGCQAFIAYFAFSPKSITGKYDVVFLNQVQKTVAATLNEVCARGEYVARVGNGEFAMILFASNGTRAEQRMLELVNKINQCQYQAVFEIPAPCHSGFYCLSEKPVPFLTAFQNAQSAYRHALYRSLDTYVFSEKLVSINETDKLKAKKLADAINNKEFEAYMQLVFDTKQNKFAGVEVLSRWNSDEGLILPGSYIGDLHACGLIEDFDMYMFDKTCNILQDWKDDADFNGLFVSCNITRTTISSSTFSVRIREIASHYDFPHEKMIIEVTEDALIDDLDVASDNIDACRKMGFKTALDDFGAGHTSFSDIHNYLFDQVKIDRQFIKTITTERGAALMKAFTEMAHSLDVPVVCEGVETKEQCNAAKKLNIDFIQGHYYSYVYSMNEIRNKYSEYK